MIKINRLLIAAVLFSCLLSSQGQKPPNDPQPAPPAPAKESVDKWQAKREAMVKNQIEARGVADPLVLKAMRKAPRHLFVPEKERSAAYSDYPLPIGNNQTISQPYIVAFMTEQLGLKGGEKVLEIGTGSGYQAAMLAEIAGRVYSIEIICELADSAATRLKNLGYKNVTVRCGDGYQGWPDESPFDAVIVTAAPGKIPQPLVDQLKPGGKMIIPVGKLSQELILVTKLADGKVEQKSVLPVRFVPMTGESQKH
jgi:protein-L-isoaspartate(D-aspartate) O-methyltransferase